MPQYKFKYKDMQMLRILESLQQKDKLCNNFLYKNKDREKFANYSLPLRINLPLRFVIRKELYNKLNNPKLLSLNHILKEKKLRMIIENGRSYSKIDPILKSSKSRYLKKEVLKTKQLLEMLRLKRIDIIIEYSNVVSKYKKYADDFVFVQIEEMPKFAFSYAVCPKNRWGEKVIKDINKALRDLIYTDKFKSHLKYLYNNKEDFDTIDNIYQNNLLNEYKK